MKFLVALLLLSPVVALAQSPFDGTWVIDSSSAQFPQKPAVFLLSNGEFHLDGEEIKADGNDHRISPTGYGNTKSVRILNDRAVELITKKAGKPMFTEVATVSPDGKTLTEDVKDTTEAQPVTIKTVSRRVSNGPPGSHAISGSWQAYKTNRSKNGSIITYHCTADGFSARTPLGEKFNAKFDGKFYSVEDDPGHTTISVKLIDQNTLEQTSKRDGKIVGVMRLTVAVGGLTIRGTYMNEEDNTTSTFVMRKQQQ